MATLNTRIVLRNDTSANWLTNEDAVLLKGEVGVEFLADGKVKQKVGDGVKTWAELPYFGGETAKTFSVGSLDEIEDTDLTVGDTAIVKTLISGDKYSYTGYVYNGTAWAAMDGNYNAENVYFDEDMMVTKEIGYITLSNGQGTIPSQGKNLKEVFEAMFVKESNPTTTQPRATITLSNAKAYEVGTKVTPSYSTTFNGGSYTYGPATGIAALSCTVTDTAGATRSTTNGTFDELTVSDNTNYRVSGSFTYGDGAVPVTNKGTPYPAGQIKAGTANTGNSSAITGYRSFFYGTLDTSTEDAPLTSAIVRGLTNGGAYNGSKTFTLNSTQGVKRIVVAIPGNSTRGGLDKVILTSAMNTPVTDLYEKTVGGVQVEGVNGAAAIDYTVYVYEPPKIDAGEVHAITLK